MQHLTQYDINKDYQKHLMRFADIYRLSQSIDDHNKSKFDWRDLLKTFNRSRR